MAHLPYRWQLRAGCMLGRLMLMVQPYRRHIAAVNLALCFPHLSEQERGALLRRHFESLGICLLEIAMSWWMPDARLRPLAHIEGLEHLGQALAGGHGVILLSAHFTTLEIGTHLLAIHARFHAMYRAHKNELFEAVMKRAREARCEKAIASDDVRGMLQSLQQNTAVWYASDQNYGHKHSIFVPFFDVAAATNPASVRLSKISGAPIVPFFIQRLPEARGYRLTLLPALKNIPSTSVENDMRYIHHLIEDQVRKAPEQYLWVHRRFKDRPPGEADVYHRA
jgi:KDO2-lipid IV(A) lauroyltransferase